MVERILVVGPKDTLLTAFQRMRLAEVSQLPVLSAAKNPENPNIQTLKKDMHDEIGIAIRIANDLIRQNARGRQSVQGLSRICCSANTIG